MDILDLSKSNIWGKVFSLEFLKILCRGAGQVMFQNNVLTGILFIIGVCWGGYQEGLPLVGVGAIISLIVSTITAYVLKLPYNDAQQGLWGFNGILVGCAFMTFLGHNAFTWTAMILCAAMSTWVKVGFDKVLAPYKVNSLTFPFVFCSWIFLLAARALEALPPEYLSSPELPTVVKPGESLAVGELVKDWLMGIGQVFLIDSWVTGIFFLAGLFICNKWAAIWAAIASLISLFTVIMFEGGGYQIAHGLYGFSPVLTGIALGMTFYSVTWRTAIWCVIGIVVTVFIQAAVNVMLSPVGLPSLTAPFCVATWLFLLPQFKFRQGTADEEGSK